MPPVIYKDHRGNRLPSVTSIIGRFKESGGLLYWANRQGLEGKTLDQAASMKTLQNLASAHAPVDPEQLGYVLGWLRHLTFHGFPGYLDMLQGE